MIDRTLAWAIAEIEAARAVALSDRDFWLAKMKAVRAGDDPVYLLAAQHMCQAMGARIEAYSFALITLRLIDA